MPPVQKVVKQKAQDYHDAFVATEAGQRVLEDLYRSYGRRQSYAPGDPYETAFREGQRSVYLSIRVMLRLHQMPEEEPIEEEEY